MKFEDHQVHRVLAYQYRDQVFLTEGEADKVAAEKHVTDFVNMNLPQGFSSDHQTNCGLVSTWMIQHAEELARLFTRFFGENSHDRFANDDERTMKFLASNLNIDNLPPDALMGLDEALERARENGKLQPKRVDQ